MIKKGLAVAVILLFIGVAFASSINANVSKDELVEFGVELYGLNRKHTVQLTQNEADEVELLFDDIQDRLSAVESDDEAMIIFNEAVVELDKYGLLGSLSVKQVQEFVIGGKIRQNLINRIDSLDENILDDSSANYLCLIGGKIEGMISQNFVIRSFYATPIFLWRLADDMNDWAFENGFDKIEAIADVLKAFFMSGFILMMNFCGMSYAFLIMFGLRNLLIFSFFQTFYAGHWTEYIDGSREYRPSDVKVTSFGQAGLKQWEGDLWGNASNIPLQALMNCHYPAILGFTGIKLTWNRHLNTSFLGFALKADFSSQLP